VKPGEGGDRGQGDDGDHHDHAQDTGAGRPSLDVVQRWFQAVVTHPAGIAAGIDGDAAQGFVRLERSDLETLVRGSSRLTAFERLSIYANAFYGRLIECLGDCFPLLKRLLGAAIFDGFAFDYLQSYPSRSYTLDRLAQSFPRFLAETRPEAPAGGEPGFPDFLIDLANLELAIAKVFDGPGCEGEPLLTPADLPPAERFAEARLLTVPCLHLLRFRFPVNAYYTAARELAVTESADAAPESSAHGEIDAHDEIDESDQISGPPIPAPATEYVALSRTDFVVRRYGLDELEHGILAGLIAGERVGDAIAAAVAAAAEGPTADETLAPRIGAAFQRFTAAGFFRAATS
jgi:putative DNA-binding protein